MNQDVADACKGKTTMVVNDTYKLFPWGDVLYSGDGEWWHVHKGAPEFAGERWGGYNERYIPDLTEQAGSRFGVNLVRAVQQEGFSDKPDILHEGANSGFAALNLALHFGCETIVLIGYDMRYIDDKAHWFGLHGFGSNPRERTFIDWIARFERAIPTLPDGMRIINATPGSALTCFEMMDLKNALELID